MYLWKCWRDTRATFLTFLGALLAVGAFGAYVMLDPFGWIAAKPLESRALWQFSADALLGITLGVVPLAGFVLGALGVGTEFEKRTADFLLTRPRSRRQLLWTSWGLGAAEMAVMVLASHAFQLTRLDPHHFDKLPALLRSLAAFCTLALVYYSLTYLMTTLAGNSRNGTALAVGVIVVYGGLYTWLHLWYATDIPLFLKLTFDAAHADVDFPLTVAGWLAVCLALAVVAQFSFERAKV